MNRALVSFLLVTIIIFLVNAYVFHFYALISPKVVQDRTDKLNSSFFAVDTSRSAEDICVLPEYDFWHPDVKREIHGRDPKANCDKTWSPWTELVNSTWRIVKDDANCSARCAVGVGGTRGVVLGEWKDPGPVECEFLEVVCWENGTEVYGYIHTQVTPKTPTPPPTLFPDPPSVFVFTIDSMNTGMAKRSFSKFLNHFLSKFEAVEFPYVNKLGENSQPNGIPLWLGKQVEKGRKVNGEEMKADWNKSEHCWHYLDNATHIFKQFKSHGYTTLLSEDWWETMVDSYPSCKGFLNSYVDHMFRPFSAVYESYGTKITKKHLNNTYCRTHTDTLIDYLGQAIDSHKDRPLFTWTWTAYLAHDHIDGPALAEDYFLEFFKKYEKVFNNSFVFFVSDHGFRMGSHAATEIGSFERNNPYLAISVPQNLRDDKTGILKVLKTNAKQLQTHYDTRATMLDILMYQPYTKFMDRKVMSMPYEKGNSLIREQPDFPRTCATLPILIQYCICQVEKFRIEDKSLMRRLGQKLLDHVHESLDRSNFTSICDHYELEEVPSLIELGYTKHWNTYRLEVKTKAPSAVHFQTLMTYDEREDTATFEKIVRMDQYRHTADCTASVGLDPQCHCKEKHVP